MAETNTDVSGTVTFETNDDLSETSLGRMLAIGSSSSYVERGLGLNPDFVADTVDIGSPLTSGADNLAFIRDGHVAYFVVPEQATGVGLPNVSGTNYIFLEYDPADGSLSYHIDDDDSAPTNPSLKIGEVDTQNETTTSLNENPTRTFNGLTDEDIQDLVGAMAGTNLTYDDANAQIDASGGGGAPTDATYLTETADGTLSSEVPIGAVDGAMSPSTGEVFGWDGSQWTNRTDQTSSGGSDLADLASGLIVYIGDSTGRQTLDPSTTNSPVKDAIDAIHANNEGGNVYLPPTTIETDTGFDMRPGISVHGAGSNRVRTATVIKRTTAGIHMVRYNDDSNQSGDPQEKVRGTVLHGIKFEGESTVSLGTQAGACIYAGTENQPSWRNWVYDIHAEFFTDSFIRQDGELYNHTWGPMIRTKDIDPESAAVGRAMVETQGIGHSWMGANELYGWGTAATHPSGTDCLAITHGGNIQIDHLNIGGAVNSILHSTGKTVNIGRIYLEPNDRVSADDVYLVRLDDTRRAYIDSIELTTADGTADRGYRIATFPSGGGTGNIRLAKIVTENGASIAGEQIRIANTDLDDPLIYEGFASEVNNQFGSTLSNPIVCLGDVTKKFSTGTGYDGGTEDSQL